MEIITGLLFYFLVGSSLSGWMIYRWFFIKPNYFRVMGDYTPIIIGPPLALFGWPILLLIWFSEIFKSLKRRFKRN